MQNIRTVLYYKKPNGQGGELRKRKTEDTPEGQDSKWRNTYEEAGKNERRIDDDVYGSNEDEGQDDKRKKVDMGELMSEGQKKTTTLSNNWMEWKQEK